MRLKQCVILVDEKLYTSYLIRSSENLPPPPPPKKYNQKNRNRQKINTYQSKDSFNSCINHKWIDFDCDVLGSWNFYDLNKIKIN